MDNNAVSASSVGKYFNVNGSSLAKQYKNHLSGFENWDQANHAENWILFEENVGSVLCIDEVSLSQGELYTIVTNASARCQKGALVAMIAGVKSEDIIAVLDKIPQTKKDIVKEVTLDMANNMARAIRISFPSATIVTDRFHVHQLVSDAVQEMRIKYRWEAIDNENKEIENCKKKGIKHIPFTHTNGDTTKQLLARSRYVLFKASNKWTRSQRQRADILFESFPDLKKAYELTMMFRSIYENSKTKDLAIKSFIAWYRKIVKYGFSSFKTAANSISKHQETILNYFNNKNTNALAENFNSKIKAFRATFRGVRDIPFFIYRITLIFA